MKIITISSAIVSWEFLEVGGFESVVVSEQGSHHAWPGSAEHQVAFTRTCDFLAVFVQQHWLNAKEWECLQKENITAFILQS